MTDAEPYPHICCRLLAAGSLGGRPVRMQRRDCAACAHERYQRTARQPDAPGRVLIDLDTARARRRAAA
ncbi:hypothetical protein AB0L86_11805 [Micromonospora musae]|uniref:hypothetical protein n=1 Tax=Micromonospora musae TaxID=1894970 RepID=UPI00342BB318